MARYNPLDIEPKWQKFWDENGTYVADLNSDRQKYFAMSMFNYPSGAGIHIGHAMNYTISDVMARFKRQQGYESYHPVGWDAFGLPAENYAIKTGVSPQKSMATIIPGYHKQYKAMGWSNDWSKEIATHEPEYYKWTQCIFAEMFKSGLAYQDSRMQWWCDKDKTVLSNEQVIDGKCWRHDAPDDPLVEKKEIKQWFFKITDYAEELLEATDALDWTESVKLAQKNWIGKSQGAEIDFEIEQTPTKYVILHGYSGRPSEVFIPWLKQELEKRGHEVFAPELPNTKNPDADEQAEFVLDNFKFDENSVLIGHSFGVPTALKVLQRLDSPIKKFVSVAGFAQPGFFGTKRPFEETVDWNFDFEKIKANAGQVVLLRANNDSAVPQERSNYLQAKIGGEIVDFTAEKDHACGVKEPTVLRHAISNLTVFTTRPDTLFGVTFMVAAPEHPLVESLTTDEQKHAVDDYVREAAKKSELERMESKEKTGVFTGSYAINPANGEKIPVWVADYVLYGYGTGAIMAVPAHDERDYAFAQVFDLPIKQVVADFKILDGDFAPREDWPTREKEVIDAIITDGKGNYLLQIERVDGREDIHFVGGGVDEEDESSEAAVRREVLEEVGYTNILSIRQVAPFTAVNAQRRVKNRNHKTWGAFYEVVVDPSEQVKSEIDEGLHEVIWVPKAQVAEKISWPTHIGGWNNYLDEKIIDNDVRDGLLVNSGKFDGMSTNDAREAIVDWLEKQGIGESKTTFKIRDWSVSRQRYWGAPVPIINCPTDGTVLVPDEDLPVVLPEIDDFAPRGDGRSALARATDWLHVKCPVCGGDAERETDTLDTYIDSSWYFLRYLDPRDNEKIFDSTIANKWMPVDFYNGGDHATAHMIYARFITRFLHKQGLLDNPEPFKRFLFNGKVTASDGQMFSKSKGNGVDPLEIISSGYGADALRTYLMFAAPLDLWIRWDPQGVPGSYRFLNRAWNLVQEFNDATEGESSGAVLKVTHPAIKKVTADLEDQKYNTAIAAMMKLTNDLYDLKAKDHYADKANWKFALESLVAMVAPFAPHIAEELWHQLGHDTSVHRDSWPQWKDEYLVSDTMTIVVQVNGKLRATLEVPNDMPDEDIKAQALAQGNVSKFVGNSEPLKVIYVPKKLVNVVVK